MPAARAVGDSQTSKCHTLPALPVRPMPVAPPFVSTTDAAGRVYYRANPAALPFAAYPRFLPPSARAADPHFGLRPPRAPAPDLAAFLAGDLAVSPRATGPFSADLTPADDVLLAALALLLILAVETLLAAALLRRAAGRAPRAVHSSLVLARDFRPRRGCRALRRVRPRVAAAAAALLAAVFALEALVLVLTSPRRRDVTNDMAAFRLLPVVDPDWDAVRHRAASTFDMPCRDVHVRGPSIWMGSITACLTSSLARAGSERFHVATGAVDLAISSYVHEFGVEHVVAIGNLTAAYSARADFRLGDGQSRLMPQRVRYFDKGLQLAFMHKQCVAFLFNAYRRQTGDLSMDMARLQAIDFRFRVEQEPDALIDVIQLNGPAFGQFRRVRSVKHTTELKGAVVPRGTAALRIAQLCFSASIGVAVAGPDRNDLQLGSGNTIPMPSVLWQEDARVLNWLSLGIVLCAALLLLTVLRATVHPTGATELAAQVVEAAIGAPRGVSPVFWGAEELKYFSLANSVDGGDSSSEEYVKDDSSTGDRTEAP